MTDTIIFQNDGLIDPFAYTTFGVSSKESKNPIGQFGTGLKYAIAVILRNGGNVEIWRGMDKVSFDTEPSRVRNDDFDFITANGERLAFTTHLGSGWAVWMAFRELYCNALDEGGFCDTLENTFPEEGKTTLLVTLPEFTEAYHARDEIVLPKDLQPLWENSRVAIYPGRSRYVYRRGVRAGDAQNTAAFTYSLKHEKLTEDRVFASMWSVRWEIVRAIADCDSERVINGSLSNAEAGFESDLDFTTTSGTSDTFQSTVKQRLDGNSYVPREAISLYLSSVPLIDTINEAADLVPNHAQKESLSGAVRLAGTLGFDHPLRAIVLKESLPGEATSLEYGGVIYLSEHALASDEKAAKEIIRRVLEIRDARNGESFRMVESLLDSLVRVAVGELA